MRALAKRERRTLLLKPFLHLLRVHAAILNRIVVLVKAESCPGKLGTDHGFPPPLALSLARDGFDKLSPNGGGTASTSSARTVAGRLRQAQPERWWSGKSGAEHVFQGSARLSAGVMRRDGVDRIDALEGQRLRAWATDAARHPAVGAGRESRPNALGSPENRPRASRTGTFGSLAAP